jgi:hypothetical protein
MRLPLTPDLAQHFAQEWIAAWNSHDLEEILSHYTDDFEMSSPLIVQLMGEASGTLRWKPAVRVYWSKALARCPICTSSCRTCSSALPASYSAIAARAA